MSLMSPAFSTVTLGSDPSPARWRRPFLTWMDGVEAGWAIPLLLICFLAVWQSYFAIAYVDGDLHSDVLETWTLGRSIEWGYSKHPPLMGWIARAWTSVFPLANWSFNLLALIYSACALWAVDLITRRFASGDKRIVVLLLLLLLPTYQFHAQRFNANTVLLLTWPIATYCFLRSFETRALGWAVVAGAAGALAMLGKYYSVFLLAGFLFAAICHPQRRAYFSSSAPWVSTFTGLAALVPHMHWLATTGAKPFGYALAMHAGKAFGASLIQAAVFLLGIALVLVIPATAWILIAGDRLARLPRDFRAMTPGLWLLFLVGVWTIILPAVIAVVLRTDMPTNWALQGLFLFAVPLVCSAGYPVERKYSVNLAAGVLAIALFTALAVGPVHALYRNFHPLHEGRNFYEQAATELTRRWHEQSDDALPVVGGDDALAFAMAFYSPDHPVYEERLVNPVVEKLPPQTTFRQGWAALCFGGDRSCVAAMERTAARASKFVRSEIVVRSTLLGLPGATEHFVALVVPPAVGPVRPTPGTDVSEDFSARRRMQARWMGTTRPQEMVLE
jgi:hypothetical protein